MKPNAVIEHILICPDCPKPYPGAEVTLFPTQALCPVGQALRWQQWDEVYGHAEPKLGVN